MEGHRFPEGLHRPLGVPVQLHVRAEHLEGVGQIGQGRVPLLAQEADGLPRRGQGLLRVAGAGQGPGEGAKRGG